MQYVYTYKHTQFKYTFEVSVKLIHLKKFWTQPPSTMKVFGYQLNNILDYVCMIKMAMHVLRMQEQINCSIKVSISFQSTNHNMINNSSSAYYIINQNYTL